MGDILSINIPPLNPPQGSTCPYVYASNVFTEEQLDSIEELGEDVVEYNESYRKSLVTTIPDNPNTGWMFNLLSRVVHQLNCEYYRFNLSVLDTIQYAFYDSNSGGKYDWHHDYNEGPSPARKLTVIVQLSDPSDYEGGELEVYPDVQIPKTKGLVAMFPSFLYHRVKPVQKGSRKALVAWVWGPPFA
jgi:PKHD-type hydroxylase